MVSRIAHGTVLAAMFAGGCSDDGGTGAGTQNVDTTAQTTEPGATQSPGPTTEPSVTGSTGGTQSGGQTNTTSEPDPTEGPTTNPPSTTTTTATATTTPDTTTTTNASSTTDDETTGGAAGLVRFVVLGDVGEGNEDQYQVADAIIAVCEQRGCDWAMLTGDNFYDSGVDGVDDPQWQEKFELPYMGITFPIYAVLGNHDYGGNGIGVDFDTNKSDYQVEYTQHSELWRMPDKYYSWKQAHAEFWGLDTNQVMTDPINGSLEPQQNWLDQTVAASTATWKIAFGHHPYLSNGDHGNAGAYEDLEGIPLPFVAGESVKEFMEESVCGKIDVYICGHDHTMQWLQAACGTEFIVAGAGSKANTIEGDNPFHFQIAEMEGFTWVELNDNSFTGVIYDKNGNELYSRTFTK
ncbi:metallophosphoesterase [Nannocystis punicea]|uniref:Metallophosphoesterase n=1 Tax=Nannocystis punicea TaxID=2995304 RepID=A0ABY7H585_9BACT|nr:metallophosphoesterase [Nannocystis poenicansa]WAS94446.1 metallophosphoesterase [Nannocystis poenicansa]